MSDINKQCTTLEQSRKLVQLGFEMFTASLEFTKTNAFYTDNGKSWDVRFEWKVSFHNRWDIDAVPCWTCMDMLELCYDLVDKDFEIIIHKDNSVEIRGGMTPFKKFQNPLLRDSLFECLIWLKCR